MGIAVLYSYRLFKEYIHSISICTVSAVVVAAIVYVFMLLTVKALSKEEFKMLPYGDKISSALQRAKLL